MFSVLKSKYYFKNCNSQIKNLYENQAAAFLKDILMNEFIGLENIYDTYIVYNPSINLLMHDKKHKIDLSLA